MQAGPFIGMVQIIVYTGAIMMLFLFVLMLVGRDASDSLIETLRGQRLAAIAARPRLRRPGRHRPLPRRCGGADAVGPGRRPTREGNVQGIAALLFTNYVFAFEVTSALLITAAVGAMMLAHVERRKGEQGQPAGADAGPVRAGQLPGAEARPGRVRHLRLGRHAGAAARRHAGRAQHLRDPADPRADLRARPRPKGTEK